jgi:AraC-like DNA-binding protein
MSLAAAVCVLLSEWISFLLVAVPPRSRRTFGELLIGCMLNPEGWVTRAIGAICREAHWTTYYKLIERAHVSVAELSVRGSPLAMANSSAMRAAEQRCKTLLHGTGGHHRWSAWCAIMLREAEDCQPTLDQLAGFMNLSSRTLSRCLDRENNGFRALSLRIRTERACRMPTDDTMSVSQIAYRLGYSDVPGFIRAFRKETGTSPTAYRTQKLRRPAARNHC